MPKISSKKPASIFQKKVFEIVKTISRGKTLTYRKVAYLAGRPKAFRAVGNILNNNHNPRIPCHRVVRSDGRIGGFNRGTAKKEYLLAKEGVLIKRGRASSFAK